MIRIALTQLNPPETKEKSLENIENYARLASKNHADLVVFPEYYMCYYKGIKPADEAENIHGGYVQTLEKISQKYKIDIITGIHEKYENRIYDTAVYINKYSGISSYYRKTHLYDAFGFKESDLYSHGNGPFDIFKINDFKIGMVICYDIRFPEIFRNYSLNSADLIVIISGWFSGPVKEEQWLNLVSVRALENTFYVASSNLVGGDFTGISTVADPIGVIINRCAEAPGIIYSDLDLNRINDVRGKMPVLSQRRPELYRLK